jgi:hydrogenase maturation protease
VGFGNILLRDEGLGVRAVEALQQRELPAGVEAIDGGTSAIDILPYLEGVGLLIILDAVAGKEPPGTIYRMGLGDIKYEFSPEMSLHDLNVPAVLQLCEALGRKPPETLIIGMQPAVIEEGLEISAEIEAALPRLLDYVLEQVGLWLAAHPE